MKRVLIPFIALAISAPAQAKPIHLQCDETKVLEDTHVIETMGRISEEEPNLTPRKNIPVFINPSTAQATQYGSTYELTVTPTEYKLYKMDVTGVIKSVLGQTQVIKTITIDRSTLKYTYSYSNLAITRSMVSQKAESTRKAEGICRISSAPSNNKI